MAAALAMGNSGAELWSNGRGKAQKMVGWNRSGVCVGSASIPRKLNGKPFPMARAIGVRMASSTSTETEKKVAKLYVKKSHTVPLPTFSDASGNPLRLSGFLREPEGRECMLNTKALRKFEDLGDGVSRCYLHSMEFLSFEVAPVLDLLVETNEESCLVDLLSCKFEGSDLVRSQNERFTATLKNHLSWNPPGNEEQCLNVWLELNVALEVYTLPFTMLPIAAVETPGTLILQALVDRLIPLFLDQLFSDFRAWAEARISKVDGGQITRIEMQDMSKTSNCA